MRALRLFLRAAARPAPERLAAAHVLGLLLRVSGSLRARGLARTQQRLGSLPALPVPLSPRRSARLVDAAATITPGATCLARSLTLAHIVGGKARVCIGVRSGVRELDAHAWVELHRDVLNDAPDVRTRYAVIHEHTA